MKGIRIREREKEKKKREKMFERVKMLKEFYLHVNTNK